MRTTAARRAAVAGVALIAAVAFPGCTTRAQDPVATKERMLALRWIRRAIDEDQARALEAEEGFALRPDIEGLDWPEAIPASRQRNDVGKIGLAFADRSLELVC